MSEEIDLKYTYYKLNCEECGKQILVEIVYENELPNMEVQAICGPCLKKRGFNEEFAENYPEIKADMDKWLGIEDE